MRFSILAVLFSVTCYAQSDIYFLPCAAKATVSFEGASQAGRDVHRLEVRRLAYVSQPSKKEAATQISCVVYFAGEEYGPSILRQIDDCIDPLVQQASKDIVEIYFLAGAHTHIRQRWRLLGHTAKLEEEREVDWRDDPRMKKEANQAPEPTRPSGPSGSS
jgi:hypothetical protein